MAEIVLFHSALGLRPGVTAAADRLRAAGHKVHTPDYYEGEVFDDLDEGLRKCDALGYQEIARRAREAGWTNGALDRMCTRSRDRPSDRVLLSSLRPRLLLIRRKRLAQLFGQRSDDPTRRLGAGNVVRIVRHGRHVGWAITG